jgi:hypothetical protein
VNTAYRHPRTFLLLSCGGESVGIAAIGQTRALATAAAALRATRCSPVNEEGQRCWMGVVAQHGRGSFAGSGRWQQAKLEPRRDWGFD